MAQSTLGIVLLPDSETETRLREMSAEQMDNDLPGNIIVHLSLLHVVLEESQISRAWEIVDSIQSTQFPIKCHDILKRNGWYFVEVMRCQQLLSLQRKLLPIAKLRMRDTEFRWRSDATPRQRSAYAKYGYPNVGRAWSPHFTFAKTKEKCPESSTPIDWSGNIRAIALGPIGDFGSVSKLLRVKCLTT